MNITVLGSGSVGLVTGACLAHLGHRTSCMEISPNREPSNPYPSSRWEPELNDLLMEAIHQQRIRFTTDSTEALADADAVFISVKVPLNPDGTPDVSQVWSVTDLIARHCSGNPLVVIQGEVPVGTSDDVEATLRKHPRCAGIHVVHQPEFLREGSAVRDFLRPNRLVVGTASEQARNRVRHIYSRLEAPLEFTDRRSAEWIQYASKAYLAMKASYAHMLSRRKEASSFQRDDVDDVWNVDQGNQLSYL